MRTRLLAAAVAIGLYLWNLSRRARNRLTCHPESPLAALLARMAKLARYQAPWWLPSGILQTLYSERAPAPQLPYQRHSLPLPPLARPPGASCCPQTVPAGTVSFDQLPHPAARAALILVPGLTGCSQSGFIRRAAAQAHEAGMEVWAYNPRGRGGNILISPFLYSAGYTEDLKRAVAHVAGLRPGLPLLAMGYSLGSNKLAKMVGEQGEECLLTAAVALACPIDLLSASVALGSTGPGRLIDRALVGFVQAVRKEHAEVLKQHGAIQMEEVAAAQTMAEFDDKAIAPMFEFPSGSQYYRVASAGLHLSNIAIPTLFIHATNDPIIPGYVVRMDDFRSNKMLLSVMTNDGGHSMDWFERGLTRSWSCDASIQFFDCLLSKEHGLAI